MTTQEASLNKELDNANVRSSRKGSNVYSGTAGNTNKKDDTLTKDGESPVKSDLSKNYPTSFADFVLLLLVGSLAAGNGYIITCVQSFEPILQSRYNYNAFTVATLNSIVSIPKIFTSFLEGYLLTKLGFVMAVFISATGLFGHVMYVIGIIADSYPLSVVGRFIVGAEFNMMFTTQYLITV